MNTPASVVLVAALCLAACAPATLERRHVAPGELETLDRASPWLKAHLRDGSVYVLSNWQAEAAAITGEGSLLDPNRALLRSGRFSFAADSVVLFETNVIRNSGVNTSLSVMFGITAAVAGICAMNPKACFGSCPTFYVPTADGSLALQAEGFSASIAPALEATDLDMLYHAHVTGSEFALRVTNEALETHVIRHMDLLTATRPDHGWVFAAGDNIFRQAVGRIPARECSAAEGDCRAALAAYDGVERWSEADSTDLAAREIIELVFDAPAEGDLGIVITSRQTLMTTFLIYQALAYMGNDVGRWLAAMETGGAAAIENATGIGRLLGNIEVLVQTEAGDWVSAGSVGETGPLASDTRVVALPRTGPVVRVRLRLTRGLWRLEQAVLVTLGPTVEPVRLRPTAVRRGDVEDAAALAALLDPAGTLVTLPGDAYDVVYTIPGEPRRQQLFLESRGYYLEWMRQEWIAEQNPILALRMISDPAGMLRQLAPQYKQGEAGMEEIFWGSRYERR